MQDLGGGRRYSPPCRSATTPHHRLRLHHTPIAHLRLLRRTAPAQPLPSAGGTLRRAEAPSSCGHTPAGPPPVPPGGDQTPRNPSLPPPHLCARPPPPAPHRCQSRGPACH